MVTANGLMKDNHMMNPAEWKIQPSFAKNLELLAGESSEEEQAEFYEADEQSSPSAAASTRKKGVSTNDSQSASNQI